MLKVLPEPKRETKEDIQNFFKARNVSFQTSSLKKELYKQLGLSELLETIESFSDIAHEKLGLNFFLILKTDRYCLQYQYRDAKIQYKDNSFKVVAIDNFKEGFVDFDGDEVCSFLEYCFEENIDVQVLGTKRINIDQLKAAK